MPKKRVTAESHPWVLARRSADDMYFKTMIEAIRFCESQLGRLKNTLVAYDRNVAVRVDDVMKELHSLPSEGGWVEAVVDEYTGAKFDAHIYRRG